MDPSSERSASAFVTPALWIALGLFATRLAVLGAMELLAHGAETDLARLRLALDAPRLAVVALGLGVASAAGLLFLSRLLRGGLRWIGWPLGTALAAGMFYLYLTGRMGEDVSRIVGGDTSRGRQALLVLAGVASVAAVVHALWLARRTRPVSIPWAALLLTVLFVPAVLARALWTSVDERMLVRETEAELFLAEWTRADGATEVPAARVLCPTANYRLDGAGMPALVLPPPARARHVVTEEGPLWLVARAGLDGSVFKEQGEELAGTAVRFRVRRNGELSFETTIAVAAESEWVDVLGEEGLRVGAGDELELETALLDAAGRERAAPAGLAAGFGGLKLERRWLRERARSSAGAPNVVFVLIDTLRADRTSLHGYGRPTTPTLEALAARDTAFDATASTASWTWPSTASVLTGMQPQEHGVLDASTAFLSETLDTLPEALQRAGATTAAWSANPLIVPEKNFDQGFEYFDAGREGSMRRTETFFPSVLGWLDAMGERRFFLYLHIVDPHSPLHPRPEARARFAADVPPDFDPRTLVDVAWKLLENRGFGEHGERRTEEVIPAADQRHVSDLYDACVWSADRWVGLVVERLERLGVLENTLIVVTSDHGEELFDHGLAAHAHSLHSELVHVPLVMAGPGVPRGERVARPVSNRQLAPTVARLAGAELTGLSDAVDLFQGAPDDVLFSTRQGWWNGRMRQPLYGLRRGDEVLHLAPEGGPWGRAEPDPDGDWRLYDERLDPHENEDLSAERVESVRALRRALEARLRTLSARRGARALEVDEGTVRMLQGIGYMGEDE